MTDNPADFASEKLTAYFAEMPSNADFNDPANFNMSDSHIL